MLPNIAINSQKIYARTIEVIGGQVAEEYQLENKALSAQSASLEIVAFPMAFRNGTNKNSSLPVSSVHGILQARILEWVAISFSGEE